MPDAFHLPEDPAYTILDSARDSVRFARRCLEPCGNGRRRAISSFVDPDGEVMHWHDFGDLEGPGWAADALGGALHLYAWGRHDGDAGLQEDALGLLDHVLDDGFLSPDGLIWGYRHTVQDRLCLNFKHNCDWLCPGSMARVALQMLWAGDVLPVGEARARRLQGYAPLTAEWLLSRLEMPTAWYPRRCTPEGKAYPHRAEGGPDPFSDGSADGLYIVWLLLELTARGIADHAGRVREKLDEIMRRGGIYGSINHDTYDADENVARAETFRLFLAASRVLGRPDLQAFAFSALAGLERLKMREERHEVATRGLLYMEDTWDTAYLWENAEVALAYLEAFEATGREEYRSWATTILRAIAKHHHGPHGFLTEGVDWNNHVGKQHHVGGAEYGAIRYTEPLLNNLHHVEAALRLLGRQAPAA